MSLDNERNSTQYLQVIRIEKVIKDSKPLRKIKRRPIYIPDKERLFAFEEILQNKENQQQQSQKNK